MSVSDVSDTIVSLSNSNKCYIIGGGNMNIILKTKQLEKYYGNKDNVTKVLDNIDLNVEAGNFIAIMGPSGSGKSTLLNCMSTIDKATSGQIFIGGQNITQIKDNEIDNIRKKDIGFIFQDFSLISTLTCYDNIALAQTLAGFKPDNQAIIQVATLLGIEEHLNKYADEISGGQQQRVAAARALIKKPKILFADEPTGALDTKSSSVLLKKFKQVNEQLGTTIIMVTHDLTSASYAQEVVFIKDGVIFNKISQFENETKEAFASRINDINLLLSEDV